MLFPASSLAGGPPMKSLAVVPLLAAVVLSLPASSHADSAPNLRHLALSQVLRSIQDDPVIPSDWDGVWSVVDSIYICDGPLQTTYAGEDTLCAGGSYGVGAPGTPTPTCTGTATSTTFDITC